MTANTVTAAPAQLRQSAAVRGRGWQVFEPVTQPAANASFTYPIDGTYWRRLLALAATLQTSAAAGLRQLALNYTDGDGNIFNQVPLLADQGPSLTQSVYADQATVTPVSELQSVENAGSQTSPAAGTTIATVTVPAGNWQISWTVSVAGTVAAADRNNFSLVQGATTILTSENGIVVDQEYPQEPVEIVVPTGGQTIKITNTALATTGAIYTAQLSVVPINPFGGQAQIPDFIMKSGWQLQLQLINGQAGDQISGIRLLTERYASSDVPLPNHDLADKLAAVILEILSGG